MNVLVIGYGSMGKRHAKHADMRGHDVRVADIDQTKLEDRVQALSDVAWQPKAVVIATPADQHVAALTRYGNLPVFVEKPVALGWSDALLRLSLADNLVTVGYNLRYLPGMNQVRHVLQHRFQSPTFATFYIHCDMATWPGQRYADAVWEMSHEIDLALHLLGRARFVSATSDPDRRRWTLLLGHDSGCQTTVRIDGTYRGYLRGAQVFSRDGVAAWTWDRKGLSLTHTWGSYRCPSDVEDAYRTELTDFLEAARIGERPPAPACDLQGGLAVMEICAAASGVTKTAT